MTTSMSGKVGLTIRVLSMLGPCLVGGQSRNKVGSVACVDRERYVITFSRPIVFLSSSFFAVEA